MSPMEISKVNFKNDSFNVNDFFLPVAKCQDANCISVVISPIDSSVNDVGLFTSIAKDNASGVGLITYWERTTQTIKLARCSSL